MQLWIVGAGGVGRETLDVVVACGGTAAGFVDENRAGDRLRGLPVVAVQDVPAGSSFVIGIADPEVRRRLAGALVERGAQPITVVHPRAVVAPLTELGAGCVVMANAHLSSSVQVGDHVQVHYNATVGHDAVLEDHASVYPGANVAGACVLRTGATVGSNACVLQGRTIGVDAFVGAGAVVTRDVADGVTVVGAPARPR